MLGIPIRRIRVHAPAPLLHISVESGQQFERPSASALLGMFPGKRQRLKVYPCPLEGEAPGVVDQYIAQGAWKCAVEVQLDICYVLFRGWRANSDGRRTSAKLTLRLPKPLTIRNEAIEAEGHYLKPLWAVPDLREWPLQTCNGATTGQALSRSRE